MVYIYIRISFLFSEMALQTISESVYVGLCLKIGTPQLVAFRTDVADLRDILSNTLTRTNQVVMMLSGSRREGFRFKDSDYDTMYWLNNYRVLWNLSQATLYNTHRCGLILCDGSESPP